MITVTNIGSANGVGAQSVTVPAGGVPSGAHIIVIGCDNGTGSGGNSNGTATDTAGNIYATMANIPVGTGVELTFLRTRPGQGGGSGFALVAGNTVTYTPGTGGTVCSMSAFWVSGLSNTNADTVALGTNSGTSSSPTVTSGTPTNTREFFIAAVAGSSLITTYNQDNSWSSPPGVVSTAAPVLGGGNQINSGAGALTYAPTFNTSDNWVAAVLPLFVAPTVDFDMPPPRGAVPSTLLKTHTQELNRTTLSSKDQFFTSPGRGPTYDYPNPRGQIPSVLHKTHIDPVKLELLSKDQFFTSAGRGPVYDYPNPRGAIPSVLLLTSIDNLDVEILSKDTFFGPPGKAPVYDWPNPVLSGYSVVAVNSQQSFVDWLMVDQTTPGVSVQQYPNPPGKRFLQDWILGPQASGGLVPNKNSWENPRGAIPLVWTITQTSINIVGPQPFTNYDWTNPLRRTDSTTAINAQLLFVDWLIVDQTNPSISNNQYPNPLGKALANNLYTWLQQPQLLPPPASPFIPPVWLNPNLITRAQVSYNVRNYNDSSPPSTNYNWPNTLGKNSYQDWIVAYRNYAFTGTPFFQGNWPNPTLSKDPSTSINSQQSYTDWILVDQNNPPVAISQWPNPYGQRPNDLQNFYEQGLSLLTFVPPVVTNIPQQITPLMHFSTFAGLYRGT